MKKIVLLNLFFISLCLKSQNNLRLYSADGSLFGVYQNDKLCSPNAQASIMLNGIQKDTLYLKIDFNNKDKLGLSVYLMDKGKTTTNKEFNYKISYTNQKLKVEFTGMYDAIILPTPLIPKAPVTDSSKLHKYINLKGFCEQREKEPMQFLNNTPKSGSCQVPMPAEFMNFSTSLLAKANTTEQKQSLLESICQNNCLTITQLNTFLGHLTNDLDKLKLVRVARPNLIDTIGSKRLEARFQSAFSVAELGTILKTNSPALKQVSTCSQASLNEEVVKFAYSLGAPENDLLRLELFKKSYFYYCYNFDQCSLIIQKFYHDRERLEAAKLIYPNCVEKNKLRRESTHLFNHQQTVTEFTDYTSHLSR